MKVVFSCFGHKNILGTHKTTLEFTEEGNLTAQGNCIVGVRSKFPDLSAFRSSGTVRLILKVDNLKDMLVAVPNKSFVQGRELVVRMGAFPSERTFAVNSSKAAMHISREIILKMKNPAQEMLIVVTDEA